MPKQKTNIFKKRGKQNTIAVERLSNMPPLPHSIPEQLFDIRNSEAARWVALLPEVLQMVWDMARASGAIKFNPETGCWSGVDTVAAPNHNSRQHKTIVPLLIEPGNTKAVYDSSGRLIPYESADDAQSPHTLQEGHKHAS